MGYWRQGEDGSSLHREETGLVWGDAPADIVDLAIGEIIIAFERDMGRKPLKAEIEAGIKFSLGIYNDNMEEA